MNRFVITFAVLMLMTLSKMDAQEHLKTLLNSKGASIMKNAMSGGEAGSVVFRRFVELIAAELKRGDEPIAAKRLIDGMKSGHLTELSRTEFAWITQIYTREFYKDEIIREIGKLMKFKTFATDVPNRDNPEFIRQKEYLRSLSSKLGLHFNDAGGYVQEIWIGEGPRSFGLMCHSDVQPVALNEWTHDPWSGEVIDGKIWGRGSVDDKGPIIAIMYGMKALLDTKLPLGKKIILLVGTDEETATEDVTTYLQSHQAPDETIVVDSNYPVISAEKGWCGVWLHIPNKAGNPNGNGFLVLSLESGFSPSIVPERAIARLTSTYGTIGQSWEVVRNKADEFMKRRAGSKIDITVSGDTLVVTAHGKTVHSAEPEQGHNALMDLLVFLDQDVKVPLNAQGLMAKFAARYIGFELDGRGLGISHHDEFMGNVTVAGNMFQQTDSTVMFMFNFRIPRGISQSRIENELKSRFREFGTAHGFQFFETWYMSKAHYISPELPLVKKLLGIYNSITGGDFMAESIGGGTYASRIPNAVVYGPVLPGDEYQGHRPDEYFLISTLIKNIEILTHTMIEFGMRTTETAD